MTQHSTDEANSPAPAQAEGFGLSGAVRESFKKSDWSKIGLVGSVAAAYGFGFIVANSFWEQHTLLGYELLKVRYISAAILFICMTFIPQGIGIVVARHAYRDFLKRWFGLQVVPDSVVSSLPLLPKREARRMFWQTWCATIAAAGMGLLMGWCLWVMFGVTAINIGDMELMGCPAIGYFVVSASVLFGTGVHIPRLVTLKWKTSALQASALIFLAYAALAAFFGQNFYPRIRPAFGGGGVPSIRIVLDDSASVTPAIDSGLLGSVLLMDRNDDYMQILVCVPGSSRLQSVELQRKAVATIEFDSVAAVPAVLRACKRTGVGGRALQDSVRRNVRTGAVGNSVAVPSRPPR